MAYIMILRLVLMITVDISIFNFGIFFDIFIMMFYISVFGFLMRSLKSQKIYYIFIIVVVSIFVVGDSLYYDYFETISSKNSFEGLKWLANGNTLEYDIKIPTVAFLVLPLFIGVIYLIITAKKKDVFKFRDFGILSIFFLLQVILFISWHNKEFDTRYEYYRSDAYLFETMYDRSLFSEKYGYYNYHILDFSRIRQKPDEEELYLEVDLYFENRLDHEINDYSDLYSGYNVISILGESLETRFIDPILTPNLYTMKSEGLSFENYYTPVFQQGATCNSEFMSITGLSAIKTNDWSNNICDSYSENSYPYSLPYQLKDIGYDTYYFHSGYEWFYNREIIIPRYGFDTVAFQEDLYEQGYDDFYDRFDTHMLYFFDEYVSYDNPFYINMLTYSMHGAYNQEEFYKYNDRVNAAHPGVDLPDEIRNYMQKLIEFDEMLGLIMERLDDNGELDNTLFVIYPDHYPYMMSSNIYTDYIDIEPDSLEIMRQDLIIYASNMTGEVISNPGSTIDIPPTILNMLDSSLNFKYFLGHDLFSDDANYILFSDLTISDGENYLYLNENLVGSIDNYLILESALEIKITALELQKKMLIIDYFKLKEEE